MLKPGSTPDPIERLAQRTAEENDRLTRQRQQEWMHARANPIFPKWVFWLIGLLSITSLVGLLKALGM